MVLIGRIIPMRPVLPPEALWPAKRCDGRNRVVDGGTLLVINRKLFV